MNCLRCQESLSPFLDNDLDEQTSAAVRAHLDDCEPCNKLHEDFLALLDNGLFDQPLPELTPNSQALWCRINNIIESEIVKDEPAPEPEPVRGLFARGFSFSFSQVGATVLGVALISSLLTVVGIRNYLEPGGDDFAGESEPRVTIATKLLSTVGLVDSPNEARERRIREHKAAIDYWDRRVQQRRAQWNEQMRSAFDRNLNEIDQAVGEYQTILQKDPEDELSGEMLDAALTEKMNLLRQFSEL